ncbi:MAG: DUF4127 family protein [Synergistaceae bacterium]|nr:DUF4127 family protein [Synergistaceae bacterium]
MKKFITVFSCLVIMFFSLLPVRSAQAQSKGKILFIPHDDRPISSVVSAEAISMFGYDVVIAPKELLGGLSKPGNPEELTKWAKDQAHSAIAAVISADAMIYGGLIPSRTHTLSTGELEKRVENIVSLKKENPALDIYVFGSLMRTPSGPGASGNEEPEYYRRYGREIFQATCYLDKKDMQGLSDKEENKLNALMSKIPSDVWQDWTERRKKNLEVSKKLIDLIRSGTLDYFIIGKDDNAPMSATHMEGRELTEYVSDLSSDKFQLLAGIDEFAMLLLARAVNKHEKQTPKIAVQYNIGKGSDTIPAFSDEPIHNSIDSQIAIAGAKKIISFDDADFILLVNTNPNGRTGDCNSIPDMPATSDKPRAGTFEFANLVEKKVNANYKVVVADIAFANGSDNALMKVLHKRNLLMKLCAYAGWNTPTNSTGFAIGQGIIAARLSKADCEQLLMARYLDDYVYQANIRPKIMNMTFNKFGNYNLCLELGEYEEEITALTTNMMRQFAVTHLPKYKGLENLEFSFPWHRTFDGLIVLPE